MAQQAEPAQQATGGPFGGSDGAGADGERDAILLNFENADIRDVIYTFAAALKAEGVSCMPKKYFLLYDMPIYTNKTAYEHSHCPWDCPAYGRRIEYRPGLCPNAEDIMSRFLLVGTGGDPDHHARAADNLHSAIQAASG